MGHSQDAVEVLDSTLREGSQARGMNITIQSKIKIALELDALGVHIIEAGWPGSNPKDIELFKALREYSLSNAEIAAFTATRRRDIAPGEDPSLNAVIDSKADLAVVFGKSWQLHIEMVLKASQEQNLDIIGDSVTYLREHGLDVIYDAEHFFDGYRDDPDVALGTIRVAEESGASRIVLADTNGGTLPHDVERIVGEVAKIVRRPLGVHMHNDSGNAVANTIMGVLSGARHVQVTVNGIGERVGNADLCQVIPNLELKLGFRTLKSPLPPERRLRGLTRLSGLVYEASGTPRDKYQPYVGEFAFAHKAGMHVDAITKECKSYEHIDPELVGNKRLITVSDLSGRATIVAKMIEHLGVSVDKYQDVVDSILNKVKEMGLKEYELDNADATVSLLLLREIGKYQKLFEVDEWMAVSEGDLGTSRAYGLVKAIVDDDILIEGSGGVGPVNAIDLALRKALSRHYPELTNVRLMDYKVVLPEVSRDTASVVRVFIEFADEREVWRTTSTSKNIIEASTAALVDGVDYYLQRLRLKGLGNRPQGE